MESREAAARYPAVHLSSWDQGEQAGVARGGPCPFTPMRYLHADSQHIQQVRWSAVAVLPSAPCIVYTSGLAHV
jgi:hypothetical protein